MYAASFINVNINYFERKGVCSGKSISCSGQCASVLNVCEGLIQCSENYQTLCGKIYFECKFDKNIPIYSIKCLSRIFLL